MSAPRTPRLSRWFSACLLAALCSTLAAAGCGGGGHRRFCDFGTIEVINDCGSFWGIDDVEVEDSFGFTVLYEVFLAPCEGVAIDVDPDDYEIRLFWSNGDVDFYDRFVGTCEIETIVGFN